MHTKQIFYAFLLISYLGNTQELTPFKHYYKYGYKDESGKIIVPAKYDYANSFKEGLAQVQLKSKHGFIDKTGKEVIALDYDAADAFHEGLARVRSRAYNNWGFDMWGYIDQTGKIVIPIKYDNASNFIKGEAMVWLKNKQLTIDKTGKELTPLKYDGSESASEGMQLVYNGKYPNMKFGFIDISGKEIIPLIYEGAYSFTEGLAAVKRNGKWGFIDKTGKEIIQLQYDDAGQFKEGLAQVNKGGKTDKDGFFVGGKYGFVDRTGKISIPLVYDKARGFTKQQVAPIAQDGKWGLIDKLGKLVTAMNYTELVATNMSHSEARRDQQNSSKEATVKTRPRIETNGKAEIIIDPSIITVYNSYKRTYNYSRSWVGDDPEANGRLYGKQIGEVSFDVNSKEIKVYFANGTLEDTHVIVASKYGAHPTLGKCKQYLTKSKKHNTTGDFMFFDSDRSGLVIKWKDTYMQYLFLQQ